MVEAELEELDCLLSGRLRTLPRRAEDEVARHARYARERGAQRGARPFRVVQTSEEAKAVVTERVAVQAAP